MKKFGLYDWEESTEDADKFVLIIAEIEFDENGYESQGDEVAVIVHRTEGGRFPLEGLLAKSKELTGKNIVDLMNENPDRI